MNLKNAAALVTGGSAGTGRAVAASLTAAGARVAITGRNAARLEEAARATAAHAIQADVSVETEVERTCDQVRLVSADATGRIVASGSGDTREEARLAAREGTNDDRVRRALDEAAESSD